MVFETFPAHGEPQRRGFLPIWEAVAAGSAWQRLAVPIRTASNGEAETGALVPGCVL